MNTSTPHSLTGPSFSVLPTGIELETRRDAIVLSRLWRNSSSWALLPIGLVLVGFCFALFHATQRAAPGHPAHYYPLGMSLITAGYLYLVLTKLFNRTRIHLSEFGVLVTHGPFPWKVEKCLGWDELQKVFLKESSTRYQGVNVTFHHVWGERPGGKTTELVAGDMSEVQAAYLRSQIQNYLDQFQQSSCSSSNLNTASDSSQSGPASLPKAA